MFRAHSFLAVSLGVLRGVGASHASLTRLLEDVSSLQQKRGTFNRHQPAFYPFHALMKGFKSFSRAYKRL